MDTASLALTSAIALVGLYLAHSLRRQQRLRIAEQRIASYCHLWSRMTIARPSRLDAFDRAGPLTREEGSELYYDMTAWYFDSGNGMMLTDATSAMYLEAKKRMGAFAASQADSEDPKWRKMSERRLRELSLLRTQMKFDLAIYGTFHPDSLDPDDEEFVRACGLNPTRWARRWPQRLRLWSRRWRERLHLRSQTPPLVGGPRWPGTRGPGAPRARD